MILDPFGRPIPEAALSAPKSGLQIIADPVSDRDGFDVSRGVSPARIDWIMTAANGGDVEAQCKLCRELPEKNHDIRHALSTRRNALSGCPWEILPGDDSEAAKIAAKRLRSDLDAAGGEYGGGIGRLYSFGKLLRSLSDALLPGFAASEIVWRPGGAGFYGFRTVEQHFFNFAQGYSPRLRVTGNWNGVVLPPSKIVWHQLDENGPDPARGGLIRPLAWLFCFAQVGLTDLMSFMERYGMPFVVAKVDSGSYEKEGRNLQQLVRAFGPNGGGVFSRNVEIELLQAASTTGDVYFRLLEYLGAAITKVVLGQTASSGNSSGLSKGDAQTAVRQDILDADARALEESVRESLFVPYMRFNFGAGVPVPRLAIATTPPEDTAALATTVKTLYDAGLQSDPDEMSGKFGIRLTRRDDVDKIGQDGQDGQGSLQLAEPSKPSISSSSSKRSPADPLRPWFGPVAAVIAELAESGDDATFGERLALLARGDDFGDSTEYEQGLEEMIFGTIAAGAVAAERKLEDKQ